MRMRTFIMLHRHQLYSTTVSSSDRRQCRSDDNLSALRSSISDIMCNFRYMPAWILRDTVYLLVNTFVKIVYVILQMCLLFCPTIMPYVACIGRSAEMDEGEHSTFRAPVRHVIVALPAAYSCVSRAPLTRNHCLGALLHLPSA